MKLSRVDFHSPKWWSFTLYLVMETKFRVFNARPRMLYWALCPECIRWPVVFLLGLYKLKWAQIPCWLTCILLKQNNKKCFFWEMVQFGVWSNFIIIFFLTFFGICIILINNKIRAGNDSVRTVQPIPKTDRPTGGMPIIYISQFGVYRIPSYVRFFYNIRNYLYICLELINLLVNSNACSRLINWEHPAHIAY